MVIFLLMMATAFMGYTSATGPDVLLGRHRHHQPVRRSRWSARSIVTWLWGGFSVDNPTLQPLLLVALSAALHVIVGVVALHVWALHVVGQNKPTDG